MESYSPLNELGVSLYQKYLTPDRKWQLVPTCLYRAREKERQGSGAFRRPQTLV